MLQIIFLTPHQTLFDPSLSPFWLIFPVWKKKSSNDNQVISFEIVTQAFK
jgi:hypothetical protein